MPSKSSVGAKLGPETWAGPGTEITDGCEARRPLADFHGAGLRSGPDPVAPGAGKENRHSVAVWVRFELVRLIKAGSAGWHAPCSLGQAKVLKIPEAGGFPGLLKRHQLQPGPGCGIEFREVLTT
jgi:hypothetical protein